MSRSPREPWDRGLLAAAAVLGVLTVGAALGAALMARTPPGHTDSRGMLMMSFASMFFVGLVATTVALIMASAESLSGTGR